MSRVPLLEMNQVRKVFGQNVALDDVSLQLHSNEILGLLGGNGAGKTTIMNILYGLYKPDAGEICLRGEKVSINSPRDAIELGIGMVHQHFLQIESFTVMQNIILGTRSSSLPGDQRNGEKERITTMARRFDMDIDPDSVLEALPMGARQKVEILKALYRGARLLILDEPTTNLTPQEVDSLFKSLRVMVEEGMSVIFITHKLREVLEAGDRITVLRSGQNVITTEISKATEESLVKAMVGEDLDVSKSVIFSQKDVQQTAASTEVGPILEVRDLRVNNDERQLAISDCSFQVHSGEILGIAGVAGNGQRELVESLLAIRPRLSGEISYQDRPTIDEDTRSLIEAGVAYIPEDRWSDGFLPTANVAQNLILGYHRTPTFGSGGLLDWKAVFSTTRTLIDEYNVKTAGPDELAANLSGGNIQRLMIARVFSQPIELLIAHNPTRGLDIPSTEGVYSKLLDAKDKGLATLLVSENLDELMLLCDRIATIYRGSLVGILPRDRFDKYVIGRMMSGVQSYE
ncbi:MAG: ABC transporter ATP-binding protein [Chloroflexota bacterium]